MSKITHKFIKIKGFEFPAKFLCLHYLSSSRQNSVRVRPVRRQTKLVSLSYTRWRIEFNFLFISNTLCSLSLECLKQANLAQWSGWFNIVQKNQNSQLLILKTFSGSSLGKGSMYLIKIHSFCNHFCTRSCFHKLTADISSG